MGRKLDGILKKAIDDVKKEVNSSIDRVIGGESTMIEELDKVADFLGKTNPVGSKPPIDTPKSNDKTDVKPTVDTVNAPKKTL
jgi:hypothetical protein